MRFHPQNGLSIRRIEDEIFIYDTSRSLIHTFNGTGVFLWDQIEKGLTQEEILDNLADTYAIDRPTAESDFEAFIASLQTTGLIG